MRGALRFFLQIYSSDCFGSALHKLQVRKIEKKNKTIKKDNIKIIEMKNKTIPLTQHASCLLSLNAFYVRLYALKTFMICNLQGDFEHIF